MKKTDEALLHLLGVERPRYMLVDASTGKDIREAQDVEVDHIRGTANFSGVSMFGPYSLRKLGGCA